MNDFAKMLIETPYDELRAAVEKMLFGGGDHAELATGRNVADEARRELEALAKRAAFLATYVDERIGGGCGDQGHAKAVKSANRTAKAVRKAFGYTEYHEVQI